MKKFALMLALVVLALPSRGGEHADRLVRIMAEAPDDAAARRATKQYLDALSIDDALAAEADLAKWARDQGVITRRQYANEMLRINERYAFDDDVAIDYWRYIAMVLAKQERGEISAEEANYLEHKKLTEVRRAKDAESRRETATRAYAEAERRRAEAAQTGAVLEAIGGALRQPTTRTDCIRVGITVKCTTK